MEQLRSGLPNRSLPTSSISTPTLSGKSPRATCVIEHPRLLGDSRAHSLGTGLLGSLLLALAGLSLGSLLSISSLQGRVSTKSRSNDYYVANSS